MHMPKLERVLARALSLYRKTHARVFPLTNVTTAHVKGSQVIFFLQGKDCIVGSIANLYEDKSFYSFSIHS